VINLADSLVYVDMAQNELFSDPSRFVGYSLLLRGLHGVWADVDLAIAFQHLLGIATGLLLYGIVRRAGAPWWAAAIAAAAVLLSIDQIFLEHALMPETAFTLSLVGALYCCVRALERPRLLGGELTTRTAWVLAAGITFGASAWLRPVTAPLIPLLAIWLVLAVPGSWPVRLWRAAAGTAAAIAVVLGYFALHSDYTGDFSLSSASGWALYSRAAPFADCSEFEPPEGTDRLCESTPPEQRPGPDFYGWEGGSPAVRLFGGPPRGDEKLGEFARAAILNQPLEYVEDVLRDSARYFLYLDAPPYAGVGYELVEVERRAPGLEEEVVGAINSYYADEELAIRGGVDVLGALQDVLRARNTLLLIALVFAIAGLFLARGPLRQIQILLLGATLGVLLVPVATAIYSARYAIPVTGELAGAAAIGFWLVAARARELAAARRAA
jgi:hypothetical protein